MSDVLTITLNPALDIASSTAEVIAGPKLRCAPPSTDPGGGGINVARAIVQLGGQATAFVALAGHTGKRVQGLITNLGIPVLPFELTGETRQSLSVRDNSIGKQYRFVMPGPEWSHNQEEQALDAIARKAGAFRFVVISGSQPPGISDGFLSLLAKRLHGTPVHLIADTSGRPLHYLNEHPIGLAVLRIDGGEADDLAGGGLTTIDQKAGFARALVERGVARTVILACGADGSVLANDSGCFLAANRVEKVESAVGAGDSFVGGFTLALAQDQPPEMALRHGTAAASAALLTPGTELCRSEDARRMLDSCSLTTL